MTSAVSPGAASPAATSHKGLRLMLWAVQVLLALFFLMAGYSHALVP